MNINIGIMHHLVTTFGEIKKEFELNWFYILYFPRLNNNTPCSTHQTTIPQILVQISSISCVDHLVSYKYLLVPEQLLHPAVHSHIAGHKVQHLTHLLSSQPCICTDQLLLPTDSPLLQVHH